MKTKIDQKQIVEVAPEMEVPEEESLSIFKATAMTVVTIIAVTLGTIYGSIL